MKGQGHQVVTGSSAVVALRGEFSTMLCLTGGPSDPYFVFLVSQPTCLTEGRTLGTELYKYP